MSIFHAAGAWLDEAVCERRDQLFESNADGNANGKLDDVALANKVNPAAPESAAARSRAAKTL